MEMRWIDYDLRNGRIEGRYLACAPPLRATDIILRIVPRAMQPEPSLERSLGYSLPFVGRPPNRAYILYDRVRYRTRQHPVASEAKLLGYVMAHEIAHLLFGNDGHSSSGVMKAFWQERDLVEIARGMMLFSPKEASLLKTGAIARMAKVTQSAMAPEPSDVSGGL